MKTRIQIARRAVTDEPGSGQKVWLRGSVHDVTDDELARIVDAGGVKAPEKIEAKAHGAAPENKGATTKPKRTRRKGSDAV